jgi:hypothetical protein
MPPDINAYRRKIHFYAGFDGRLFQETKNITPGAVSQNTAEVVIPVLWFVVADLAMCGSQLKHSGKPLGRAPSFLILAGQK